MSETIIERPRLSLVMPCFNQGDMARIMIDSIVANDYQDWELLLVDDGSDEATLALLKEYANNDTRIHVMLRPASCVKGAQSCRNLGLSMAQGEFLIFFDSDDYVMRHCLGQRVRMLSARADLDFMVFPSAVIVDGNKYLCFDRDLFGYKVHDDDIAAFARRELPFVVWNNIYRTESLRKNNISWDINLRALQDADFNLRTLLAGMRYDYAEVGPDFYYRTASHSASVSRNIVNRKHLDNNEYASRRFYEQIQGIYGHKYDKDIYYGICFITSQIFLNVIDADFCTMMSRVVTQYDKKHSIPFRISVLVARLLAHCLSPLQVRRLSLLPYLLYLRKKVKGNRQKAISLFNKYTIG